MLLRRDYYQQQCGIGQIWCNRRTPLSPLFISKLCFFGWIVNEKDKEKLIAQSRWRTGKKRTRKLEATKIDLVFTFVCLTRSGSRGESRACVYPRKSCGFYRRENTNSILSSSSEQPLLFQANCLVNKNTAFHTVLQGRFHTRFTTSSRTQLFSTRPWSHYYHGTSCNNIFAPYWPSPSSWPSVWRYHWSCCFDRRFASFVAVSHLIDSSIDWCVWAIRVVGDCLLGLTFLRPSTRPSWTSPRPSKLNEELQKAMIVRSFTFLHWR